MPPPEIPPPRGLPVAPQGLPGIGRSEMIKSAVGRYARAQLAAGPRAPGQHVLAPPMSVPSAPQVAPPLHQPRPNKAATPYQQAVQVPGKSTGRGVTVDSPSDRAAPTASQTTQDCGRQQTSGGVTEASRPVTPGVHEGQHQMYPQLPPRKSLRLNEAALQRPQALTLHCLWQNSAAVGGRKTLSMCSRSTISTTYKPPTGRLNG